MPARSKALVSEAAVLLREEILSGELAPGARVHLVEASERMHMSIVPIREALRGLASEGLLVALPQRGFRVADVNRADFDDTYRLRLELEPLAVRLAVSHMDDVDRRVQEAFDALADAYIRNDWRAHAVEHRRFHFAIYDWCRSPWLLRFLGMLWDNSIRYQRISGAAGRRGSVEDRIDEHRRILDACIDGDTERAGEALREHLQKTVIAIHVAFVDVPSESTQGAHADAV